MRKMAVLLLPINFISDPDSARCGKDLLGGVKKNRVIVTVGPIVGRARNVKGTELAVVRRALWAVVDL
jgi:hypothetical protein